MVGLTPSRVILKTELAFDRRASLIGRQYRSSDVGQMHFGCDFRCSGVELQ